MVAPPAMTMLHLRALGQRLAGKAVDAVLPPRCLECGAQVADDAALCPTCWQRIEFLGPPCCACCGHPFETDMGASALCGACAAESPPFARARAVFRYDDASRGLVLRFKHADRTDAAPSFGRWLARVGVEIIAEADVVVPVPMHWFRLFLRRYNQAALLAFALARAAPRAIPVVPDLLVRRRWTPSQGRHGRSGRHVNLAGAIVVGRGRDREVAGKRCVLIDDVLTTGATASACARALLARGARAVDVLTLARVVRD